MTCLASRYHAMPYETSYVYNIYYCTLSRKRRIPPIESHRYIGNIYNRYKHIMWIQHITHTPYLTYTWPFTVFSCLHTYMHKYAHTYTYTYVYIYICVHNYILHIPHTHIYIYRIMHKQLHTHSTHIHLDNIHMNDIHMHRLWYTFIFDMRVNLYLCARFKAA